MRYAKRELKNWVLDYALENGFTKADSESKKWLRKELRDAIMMLADCNKALNKQYEMHKKYSDKTIDASELAAFHEAYRDQLEEKDAEIAELKKKIFELENPNLRMPEQFSEFE